MQFSQSIADFSFLFRLLEVIMYLIIKNIITNNSKQREKEIIKVIKQQ